MIKITNVHVFNAAQCIFEPLDVYIEGETIFYVGNAPLEAEQVVDGAGGYLIPGLIDSHMHIESSMTQPNSFSAAVLPHGTTTVLADAHEVGNVFGVPGLLDYMNQDTILDIFYAIPSSVPSTNPSIETNGALIDGTEVEVLSHDPKVIALGEIMNFKDTVSDRDSVTKRVIDTFRRVMPNAPLEGHIPNVTGPELAGFLARGIGSDHTQQTPETLLERARNGVFVQLQEKSLNEALVSTIIEHALYESIGLVTDDVMPDDLVQKGHLDHIVHRIVDLGMPFEKGVYMATATPARHLGLRDRGWIGAGRLADLVLLREKDIHSIQTVWKRGKTVAEQVEKPFETHLPGARSSLKRAPLTLSDFVIPAANPADRGKVRVRVMRRCLDSTYTEAVVREVTVVDGRLDWQAAGLSLIVSIERYGNGAPLSFGFVDNGFNVPAAMATSWAHDSHNLLVMGTDPGLMCRAANRILADQGGMVMLTESAEAVVPLSYGGIVSLLPMETLAAQVGAVRRLMRESGYVAKNEIMSFAVLPLLVSPELKISDKGYVDTKTQEILPLFLHEEGVCER